MDCLPYGLALDFLLTIACNLWEMYSTHPSLGSDSIVQSSPSGTRSYHVPPPLRADAVVLSALSRWERLRERGSFERWQGRIGDAPSAEVADASS
jgi:hypothetical protein